MSGQRLRSLKAAVTGAGGFIGNAICRRLAVEGAEVLGLDVNPDTADRVRATGSDFVAADVADRESLVAALDRADLVVHTAAQVREWGSMDDFVRVNVAGTAHLLDACAQAGAGRVVHISSVVVYGYESHSDQDESAPRRTYGNPYIDTKSASDRLACRRGAVVIRPGDVYGPGSVPWTLRPLQMARAGQLAVPGRGDGLMLPLYIDDLAEAVVMALADGKPGEAYTVWDDRARVTFEDHFNRLARLAGAREARRMPRPVLELAGMAMEGWAKVRGTPPAFSAGAVTFIDRRAAVSAAKARDELGWAPQVAYEDGMRRTEEWLRAEGLI